MSIDQVLKETIIELPKSLSIDETEKLMEYLANQLQGDIQYKVAYGKSIIHGSEGEGLLKLDGSVGVSANIKSYRNGARDWFSCEPDEIDMSKISVIKFNMVPGWDLPEYIKYRKEVVELWREVRNLVTQYFSQDTKLSKG